MRYLIKFSYDGSNFSGFQKQNGFRTVEEELEKAVSFMNRKQETSIYASGRTDKGVHAISQYAHFDMDIDIDLYKVKTGINSMLPNDIHIIDVYKVNSDFHARYDVLEKEYKYYLNMGEFNPIKRNYCYQYCKSLDVDKIRKAILLFKGTHDFRSFISSEDKRENTVRTITDCQVDVNNDILCFTFRGNGFMKYQIRNMVGSLIEVGCLKKKNEDIVKIMDMRDRKLAGVMAPSCGLYLVDVFFKNLN